MKIELKKRKKKQMHGINISGKKPKRSPAATDNNATEIIKKTA